MNWNESVEKIKKYVVRIETPQGWGTGFLFIYNEQRTLCGVATANHVLQEADLWQQPIRVRNLHTGSEVFLKVDERAIIRLPDNDLAVILFDADVLDFPKDLIALLPSEEAIGIGTEVGWLGFPNIDANTLCFFSGTISARKESESAYLIDGVAINGVSGGPVFFCSQASGIQIIGIVSAYHANRASGDALPGLLIAQDVSKYHGVISHVHSVDEANREKQAIEQVIENDVLGSDLPRHAKTKPTPTFTV
ncbi:MAG: serine protease [Pyrinomonadaceae bacterium]